MSVPSAEPIVRFTLTIAQFEQLCILAREANPLHAQPDDYTKEVLIEHLFLRMAKARRKVRGEKLHRLEYDKLTGGEAPR
jgi:hypothetical protein